MRRRPSRCGPDLLRGPLASIALAGLALLCLAGCDTSTGTPSKATGVVIDVDAPDVARVDHFTIRTADGEIIEFVVEDLSLAGGGKPAPHLREHLTSGIPVAVEYVAESERNLAIRYYDAP